MTMLKPKLVLIANGGLLRLRHDGGLIGIFHGRTEELTV